MTIAKTVYNVTLFGLEFNINPVAFTLPIGDGWDVYWYGILIASGFALAVIYAMKRAGHFGLDPDRLMDVVLVATPVAIVSARAYYLLFDAGAGSGFKNFFDIHSGGLAIYGGLIGAVVAGAIMCKIRKVNILDLLDVASLGFLIGQAIGRWGNFFNQEAYGSRTNSSWWGMTSNKIQFEYGQGLVHPCFLYESLWCILGFILLHTLSRRRNFKGEIILSYGAWYGLGRFFIEGLRTDSLMMGENIRVSQLLSALLFIACTVMYITIRLKLKNKGESEYKPLFEGESGDTMGIDENDNILMDKKGTDAPSDDADDDGDDDLGENIDMQYLEAMGGIQAEVADDLGENTYDPTLPVDVEGLED